MPYSATRNRILIKALRKVRALSTGEDPTADLLKETSDSLNDVIKSLEINAHVKLWAEEWKQATLTESSVVIGSDGANYRCIRGHTADSTNKPVTGAEWSTYWVIDTSGTGVAWVTGTAYVTIAEFTPDADTMGIKKAFYRENNNGYDTPLKIIGMQEYFDISDKRWASYPDTLVFIETIPPACILYPHPRNTDYVIHYLKERSLTYLGAGTDDADFPDRWINALIWALSAEIATEFGLSINEKVYLDTKAEKAIKTASYGVFNGLSIGQFESQY